MAAEQERERDREGERRRQTDIQSGREEWGRNKVERRGKEEIEREGGRVRDGRSWSRSILICFNPIHSEREKILYWEPPPPPHTHTHTHTKREYHTSNNVGSLSLVPVERSYFPMKNYTKTVNIGRGAFVLDTIILTRGSCWNISSVRVNETAFLTKECLNEEKCVCNVMFAVQSIGSICRLSQLSQNSDI